MTFPLARYAVLSIPWHIAQVEAEGIPQSDLPEIFSWPSDGEILQIWAKIADVIDFLNNVWRFEWPVEGSCLLHLVAEHGIRSAFDCMYSYSESLQEDSMLLDPQDIYHRTPFYFVLVNNQGYILQKLWAVDYIEKELLGPLHSTTTPLHIAVDRRNFVLIKSLIELSPDLDIYNGENRTPMAVAIANEDVEIIKVLLTAGAGRNAEHSSEGTVIHYAVRKQDLGLLRYAIAAGVDVNAQDKFGNTPLFSAMNSHRQRFNIIQELLAAGADPQIADRWGDSPLHFAVDINDSKLLVHLLGTNHAAGSRQQSGENALMRAVKYGRQPHVNILLERGFVPDLRSANGRKALRKAADRGDEKIVLYLLRSTHANPNDVFEVSLSINYIAIANGLLDADAIDMSPDLTRDSPLHAATRSGDLHLVRRIFQHPRTDMNRQDRSQGRTALFIAVESGDVAMMHFLLAQGGPRIDPDLPDRFGRTPLLYAGRNKMARICSVLLATGRVAAVPPPDMLAMTPLSAAVDAGAEDVVRLLLDSEELRGDKDEVCRAYRNSYLFRGLRTAERRRIDEMLRATGLLE